MVTNNSLFKNYKLIIGLAVIFGLLAVYSVHSYTSKKVSLRPAVLVKEDIEAGHQITEDDLVLEMKPQGGINSDVFSNPKDAAGQVAKGFIPKNTPLRASMTGTGVSGNPVEDLARFPGRVLLGFDYKVDTTAGYVTKAGVLVDVDSVKKKESGGQQKSIISGAPVLYVSGQGNSQSGKQSVVIGVLPEEKKNYLDARSEGADFIVTVKGVAR